MSRYLHYFRLAFTVCLFVGVLLAALPFQMGASSGNTSAVTWQPYSRNARNRHLANGKEVLVFVYAELAVESEYALRATNAATISKLLDGKPCEKLLLRYDNWDDPDIGSIWKAVGHTKYPMFVLFSPNEAPRVFPYDLNTRVFQKPTETRSYRVISIVAAALIGGVLAGAFYTSHWRFSLRTLFFAVTLLAVLLGTIFVVNR
jgi:hypothetical protein